MQYEKIETITNKDKEINKFLADIHKLIDKYVADKEPKQSLSLSLEIQLLDNNIKK